MANNGQCYVLKLRKRKWYVGYTEKGIERIETHLNENGSKWTRKYPPVKPIRPVMTELGQTKATPKNKPNNDEDKLTLKMMKKHGIKQVQIWRRSFDIPPPPMKLSNPYHPSKNKIYANLRLREKVWIGGELVSNPLTEIPSEEEVNNKLAELQADFDANEYKVNRQREYPSIQECVHAILDDDLESLQILRQAVKEKYPK